MNNSMNVNKRYPSQEKPWLKYFPKESINTQPPQVSLYRYVANICLEESSNNALYYYGTKFTYKELLENIDRTADAYYNLGVRSGDIVSFVSVSLVETIFSMYALNKIGAVANFIDVRGSKPNIVKSIKEAESKVLVLLDMAYPKLVDNFKELNLDKIVIQSFKDSLKGLKKLGFGLKNKVPAITYSDKIINWNTFISYADKGKCIEHEGKPEDTAVITYTGGTTGTPKGVMLTNLGANSVGESFARAGVDQKPGDRFLNIMPLSASYGVICGLHMSLSLRFFVYMIPNFDLEKLPALVMKFKPQHMMAVPVFYERMMESPLLQNADLSFLYTMGCGGDTINLALEKKCNDFFMSRGAKHPISQGYGMSEAHASATCCFSDVYKDGSVGIPLLLSTIGIFKPGTDEELGYGEEGEVCVSGSTIFKGYYNRLDETENVLKLHSDGKLWVHSGDLGTMDEDGFIFIKGRFKRAITRFDGHKVFPLQIESSICTHPDVANCVAIAWRDISHAQGFLPLAIVKLKDGITLANEAKEKLRQTLLKLAEELNEERGWPIDVVIADSIPLTALGKDDYRALEELYKDYRPHSA